MKKPMSQKAYKDSLGDICPNCGEIDIASDCEWIADFGVVSRKVSCILCNHEWVEFYNLAGYDNLQEIK